MFSGDPRCCCCCCCCLQFALASPYYRRYFCPSGRLALEMDYRLAPEPLEGVLQQEHGFEPQEVSQGGCGAAWEAR
jgi:hypothetical protein